MSYQTLNRATFRNGPRVLLCERQTLVRQGLRCLLEAAGCQIVAEAADGCDCLTLVFKTRPDVVVLDVQSCHDATLARLQKTSPGTKIVVLTSDEGDRRESESKHLGYSSVSRNADAATLAEVVRDCGGTAWEPWLPARDREVLRLVALGRTNKEIGSALGLAEKTVRCRLTDVFATLGVRNRTEAALYALGRCDLENVPERATLAERAA